jgi:hypothetical protein
MNAFQGIVANVKMPTADKYDDQLAYPLSQMPVPRKAEYVIEKKGRNEPRNYDFDRGEIWQFDEDRQCSRPAYGIEADDMPEEFFYMMAQDMLQREGGDGSKKEKKISPQASAFAAGTPQNKSPEARPLAARLAAPAANRHTPSKDFAVSLALPKAQDEDEIERLAARLRRMHWVENPWFIKDEDWTAMIDMTVQASMSMFDSHDAHLVEGLGPMSFWPVMEPLMRGKIFSPKQKVKQFLQLLSGNVHGAVGAQHNYRRQQHDLVRYLAYMQSTLAKLRSVDGHERHCVLDDEDFMEHIITHVGPFMHVRREYDERKDTSRS